MKPLHKCAALSCSRRIPTHLLMCIDHWRMVPAPLQRRVLAAWQAMRNTANVEVYNAAHSTYLQARDEAIAAVTAKLEKRAAEHAGGSGELFKN
jgi:hypothetical protein